MTTVLINGRNNQQTRGISINQDDILPKLTAEQRATWGILEKKAYNAARLKQYRGSYSCRYAKEVVSKRKADARKEKEDALVFYRSFKEQLVIPPLVSLELVKAV